MEFKYVLIIIIIILAILFLYNKQENIDSTNSLQNLSNEAIQNIASVYNNQNLKATNIEATGKLTGKICSPSGNFCLVMQNDGNLVVYDKDNKPKFATIQAQTVIDKFNAGTINSADGKYKLTMQTDGNLAINDTTNNSLKWAAIEWMKSMNGKYRLAMQDDANLVIWNIATNTPIWRAWNYTM